MKILHLFLAILLVGNCLMSLSKAAYATPARQNVVIIVSDDQRWDKITPRYMPNVYKHFVRNGIAFKNSFVPNSLCCPSRTSILTGNYSHTTGVWQNAGPYGGFEAFDDKHTIAVDFKQAGYRTAMIGKYLNGYYAEQNLYVPPGWDTWFATNSGVYYDFGVSATGGKPLHFPKSDRNYSSRVLSRQAINFVKTPNATKPFFLYYSFAAPHKPSIPDPFDVNRFVGETDSTEHDLMLASAFGMDREIGRLFKALPANTLVVFMSDNGFQWGEPKAKYHALYTKQWPYNESIRVPIYMTSLDGSLVPKAKINDIVLNIDLRTSLTHAVGIAPITRTDGINLFSPNYVARTAFPLEHYGVYPASYCGAREVNFMYVRYQEKDGYKEELYNNPTERKNLVGNSTFQADYLRLKAEAMRLCNPAPPGYRWQ